LFCFDTVRTNKRRKETKIVRKHSENGRQRDSKTSTVLYIDNAKKKPGRPCKHWQDTVCGDLKDVGVAWDDVEELVSRRNE